MEARCVRGVERLQRPWPVPDLISPIHLSSKGLQKWLSSTPDTPAPTALCALRRPRPRERKSGGIGLKWDCSEMLRRRRRIFLITAWPFHAGRGSWRRVYFAAITIRCFLGGFQPAESPMPINESGGAGGSRLPVPAPSLRWPSNVSRNDRAHLDPGCWESPAVLEPVVQRTCRAVYPRSGDFPRWT